MRGDVQRPPDHQEHVGTQLVGGAFAAMTAAVIGAQLGVAGTVLGAAIGSIVAGTAGSLYTASLKHTSPEHPHSTVHQQRTVRQQ